MAKRETRAESDSASEDGHEVTRRLDRLQQGGDGDLAAVGDDIRFLFDKFLPRVVGLARKKLDSSRSKGAEDVALEVLAKLHRTLQKDSEAGAELRGDGVLIRDRKHLWNLLRKMVEQGVIDVHRARTRQKRKKEIGESGASPPARADAGGEGLARFADPVQSARDIAAQKLIDCVDYVTSLPDEKLKLVGTLYLSGHSQPDIVAQTGASREWVRQKVERITELLNRKFCPVSEK